MPTRTDKVPNTSATAASCGTDLNGAAVKNACDILRARLLPFAAEMLSEKKGNAVLAERIVFNDNMVSIIDDPKSGFPFAELLQRAYFARTSLSHRLLPHAGIHYDRDGRPRKTVSLFRLRRGCERSGSRRIYRHDARPARRYSARCRRRD